MIYTNTQKRLLTKKYLLNSFNHMFRGARKVAARDAATKMYGAITWGRSNQIP